MGSVLELNAAPQIPRVEELRRHFGMDLGDLADAVGVDILTVLKWERGEMGMTDDQLVKLSDIFKCAPQYVANEEWVVKPEERACVATELSALAERVEEAARRIPRSSEWRYALLRIRACMRESAEET